MNSEQPLTSMYSGGFDFKSIGACLITVVLSNMTSAAPVWLDSMMKALASLAAISTITYNGVKMWMEVMEKGKANKPQNRFKK